MTALEFRSGKLTVAGRIVDYLETNFGEWHDVYDLAFGVGTSLRQVYRAIPIVETHPHIERRSALRPRLDHVGEREVTQLRAVTRPYL